MAVINWQTDPIYFDEDPKPVNQWANANELIDQGAIRLILTEELNFNLYPILVRRVDFLREKPSDRVLARFPYVELTSEEKEIISENQLLIAEKLRDYFYKSDNRKILAWRDILLKDLERGYVPLPFLRCFPEEIIIDLSERKLHSARGEQFTMPAKLTKELAYLCGMVNGDGSLKKYVLSIIDYSFTNIKQLKQRFEKLFTQTGRIQQQTENSPELIITNLWVVRFFSFLTNHPIGGKKYSKIREPKILAAEPFRSTYWSGVMDADGSYKNRNVTFASASKQYALDFKSFLETLGIIGKYTERPDNTFTVYIPVTYHQIYKTKLISLHPEKKLQFMQLKQGTSRKFISREQKKFVSFNDKTLINGFFNFALLKRIQLVGLDQFLKDARGTIIMQDFAKQFGISQGFVSQIENKRSAIPIELLEKIFNHQNKQLMPFLLLNKDSIKYRKMNSSPIKLDLKPNNTLKHFAKNMHFHKTSISLPKDKKDLQKQIENHFSLTIKENRISNKLLHYYFTTFCILEDY